MLVIDEVGYLSHDNRHPDRGTVLHGLLDVIDGHVVPEDGLGVAVVLGDGCAREGQKRGLGQDIAKRPC